MSPSQGSGTNRGLTYEQTCADRIRMRSAWVTDTVPKAAPPPAGGGRARERGQALVEFALIAPLFLLLVVGIIQFGIGLNYWLDLNRIANQGARWAVVDKYPNCNGTVGSPGCGAVAPAPDSPTNPNLKRYLESQPVSGGLRPTATICFEPATAPALPGQVGQPLSVHVQSDFTFLPLLDLGTIRLRGKATMRIEQDPVVLKSQGVGNCP